MLESPIGETYQLPLDLIFTQSLSRNQGPVKVA